MAETLQGAPDGMQQTSAATMKPHTQNNARTNEHEHMHHQEQRTAGGKLEVNRSERCRKASCAYCRGRDKTCSFLLSVCLSLSSPSFHTPHSSSTFFSRAGSIRAGVAGRGIAAQVAHLRTERDYRDATKVRTQGLGITEAAGF